MSGLLTDKVLRIFLHNPAYERDGFRMWGRILGNYDPGGKYALFESVSDMYTLEQSHDEPISAYTSRSRRLFRRLRGITFYTI